MIGSDLEGADLESRVASWAASAISDDAAAVRAPGLYVPFRRRHRPRRPRGSQGNKPGDDHDPRYRRNPTSAFPEAARSGTHGGHWKITHVPADAGAAGGGCSGIWWVRHPDSDRFRIRLRSPSTTRLRLRRRLRARTGAVQVDAGVAGAVRVPALGAPALLAVTAPAHRCTEGNVKAGPAI